MRVSRFPAATVEVAEVDHEALAVTGGDPAALVLVNGILPAAGGILVGVGRRHRSTA